MAKRKSFLGTLATLGGLAAATAVAYAKREELKKLLNDVADRYFPADDEDEAVCEEPEVIIDVTCTVHCGDEDEETVEETPED